MADLAAYNDFERELKALIEPMNSRISQATLYESDPDAAQNEFRRIGSDIAQAKSFKQLSSMELEARVMPDVTRKELGDRITQYRSTLSDLSKSLEAARSTVEKSSLVERDVAMTESREHRDRMVQANRRLGDATTVLRNAQGELVEAEDIAVGITDELSRNRETIHNARRKLRDTNVMLDDSGRIVRRMTKREVRIKIMLGVFILVILGVIGLVLYFALK